MERQKSILGRKKRAAPPAPGDFIALGKQAKTSDGEAKRPSSPPHAGRKKESSGSPLSSSSIAKKPKLGGSSFSGLGRPHSDVTSSLTGGNIPQYDEIAVTVEATEFLPAILAAEETMNDEQAEALICGAVKHLRSNRAKPDQIVSLTLMYLSKSKPALFCTEVIIEAFCGLLKREVALTFKAKGNPAVSVLACNVLMNAFAEEETWPDNFVKVFVEDSLGERVWVDRDDCRGFVDNILTAFGTKKSSKHLLKATAEALRVEPSGASSPSPATMEEDDTSRISDGGDGDKTGIGGAVSVVPRYSSQLEAIESYVLDTMRDILNHRQSMDSSSRNLIRLMTSCAGFPEVRSMAAHRMEMWLQNPKLTRVAQDLLLAVCTNCDKPDKTDREVVTNMTKMRMKTKPLVNHFLTCIRELLTENPQNLQLMMNITIYNELSTSRNPNNMLLLGVIFSQSPDSAAKILAEVFQDLLANKDDYLRALRMLLREIVRSTRLDMNFYAFCLGLMQERTGQPHDDMDSTLRERYIVSIADLVSMDVLLSVAPSIREAAAGLMQGDQKNLELIHVFKRKVAVIQRDAVWWLHMVVPKIVELKADPYLHCFKKVLFLESAEQYYNKDNWPPESERWLMLKLAMEAPVIEDTLMRVMVVGYMKEMPLSAPDAVELTDQLVRRAASLYYGLGLMDVLQMKRVEFFEALLNLCAYKHPENIVLPQGYSPPNLAIMGLMWKSWLILLIMTAYNPAVFGETAWQKYPTLQFLMEMVMTNNYNFPPPTTASDEKMAEEFRARERQIRQQEIQQILEFETHLAAATSKMTITESTSLLIGQLNHNDPMGPARFPPQEITEQLKSLNNDLKLGQMLCRSRNPDFLLRIINRQGTSQSMPWLAELVESSEGSLDVLPVQCLCEFLLHEPTDVALDSDVDDIFGAKRKHKNTKHQQLLSRLQDLVHNPSAESKTMKEVLDYFLQRLASTQAMTRQQAVKGLSLVVGPAKTDESMEVDTDSQSSDDWLLIYLPSLPLFHEVKDSLCLALRKACQVETDPEKIRSYILFLAQHALDDSQGWNELVLDIAQLLVERTPVVKFILPELATTPMEKDPKQQEVLNAFVRMFVLYMRVARKEDKDTFSWSNTQDQIRLEWDSGQSATVHILVVHAVIVLLTFGPPSGDSSDKDVKNFKELYNIWIQENNRMPPGFLLDTSEEALLLPDWLKLRMLRSHDEGLISAAMAEVEPSQLVLFMQSFGIPVLSMSRLLAALDQALTSDPSQVLEAIQSLPYMAKLVEVQHSRGATGGHVFYSAITQGRQAPAETAEKRTEEEMPQQDVWNVKGSGEVILPTSADKISRLLDQVFSDTGGLESDAAKMFQCLIQTVSTDKTKTSTILKAFDHMLSSSKKEVFAKKVFNATYRSCPIFKILIAKQPDLHAELLPVMEKLHSLAKGQKSMLTAVVTQFLTAQGSARQPTKLTAARQAENLLARCTLHGGLDSNMLLEDLSKLKNPERLESVIHRLMESLLAQGRSLDGTRLACHVLAQDSGSPMPNSTAALFIDWLSMLDPEIIQANPELEQKLLFARSVVRQDTGSASGRKAPASGSGTQGPSQAHLLALLTHQTSWRTLTQCLARLLRPDRISQLEPTAVLDFVWACEHIPKIWQGREKITPEVEQKEDVLGLSNEQVASLADLILEEALLQVRDRDPELSADGQVTIMKGRVDLLLSCLSDDLERVLAVVSRLQKLFSEAVGLKRQCAVSLATSLYLQFPYIQAWLTEDNLLMSELMASQQVQSQMDILSHRLITSLGQAKPGKQAGAKMYDANIACRKMAAHHPDIFLRQLPLMAAILSGQSEYSLGAMRHNQQFQLFTHVLGLVELLQPHVFQPEHTGFTDVLDAFFDLLKNHGHEQKALGPVVHKLVCVLQNFLSQQHRRAFPVLQQQLSLISRLASTYPDMFELKALLTSLTLPRQPEPDSETSATQKQDGKVTAPTDQQVSASSYSAAQLALFMRRFNTDSSEGLLIALRDLDEMSKRKVDILGFFQSQLQSLMMSINDQCRGTAFTLVMRALRYNPRKAGNYVATYLDCLECDNPDIVISALKNLGEFTALCHEEATIILQKAFQVGIKSSVDASSYISEALQVLNLHSASA